MFYQNKVLGGKTWFTYEWELVRVCVYVENPPPPPGIMGDCYRGIFLKSSGFSLFWKFSFTQSAANQSQTHMFVFQGRKKTKLCAFVCWIEPGTVWWRKEEALRPDSTARTVTHWVESIMVRHGDPCSDGRQHEKQRLWWYLCLQCMKSALWRKAFWFNWIFWCNFAEDYSQIIVYRDCIGGFSTRATTQIIQPIEMSPTVPEGYQNPGSGVACTGPRPRSDGVCGRCAK